MSGRRARGAGGGDGGRGRSGQDPRARRPTGGDERSPGRLRRPQRVSDLLPDAARGLGLERELRLARAIATWDALIAERVPPAVGACRLVRLEPDAVVIAATEPIVAAELRMRALELLAAFAAAPGGGRVRYLRVVVEPEPGGGRQRAPRV
jgi:Dna[CI] antecedent, DciA